MYAKTEVGQTLRFSPETPAKISIVINEYGRNVFSLTHEQALELQRQLAETLAEYNPDKNSWRD